MGLAILTSKLDIKILNLIISSQNKKHINDRYEIIVKLKIFGTIPTIKFTLNKNKIRKMQQSLNMKEKVKQLEKDIMQNKNELDVQIIKGLKEFSKVIYIEKLDLEIELGT